MKEREFQAGIIEQAETHGWRVWHVPTPMRPIGQNRFVPDPRGRGLPDLLMIHERTHRLVFAEVKNEDGKLSVEQNEALRLLRGVETVRAYVFRPGVEPLINHVLAGTGDFHLAAE